MKKTEITTDQGEMHGNVCGIMATGADFARRTLYLITPCLDMEAASKFLIAFHQMDASEGIIRIVFLCAGGAEPAGWAIYDAIREARNPVIVDAYGAVWSMGALVLQGGDQRRMSKECRLMIHAGTVEMDGSTIDQRTLVAFGAEARRTNQRYERVLAERTGVPLTQMQAYCQAETYFSARRALKHGFIDAIIPYSDEDVVDTKNRKRK